MKTALASLFFCSGDRTAELRTFPRCNESTGLIGVNVLTVVLRVTIKSYNGAIYQALQQPLYGHHWNSQSIDGVFDSCRQACIAAYHHITFKVRFFGAGRELGHERAASRGQHG